MSHALSSRIRVATLWLAACGGVQPAMSAMMFTETWDGAVDTAGWFGATVGSTLSNPGAGGNPGGYLSVSRANSILSAATDAPAATGAFQAGLWTAQVDLREIEGDVERLTLRFRVLPGNGWNIQFDDELIGPGWESYSIGFDPGWTDAEARANGWDTDLPDGTGSLSWSETMSLVGYTEFRFDAGLGFATVGIDNFRLIPPSTGTVPVPGTLSLLFASAAAAALTRRRSRPGDGSMQDRTWPCRAQPSQGQR